jgi:hypothetical protein
MKHRKSRGVSLTMATASLLVILGPGLAQVGGQSSYAPVDIKETFASIMARMRQAKPEVEKRHANLLNERYDLGNRPAQGVTMSRGKPVQEGVRAKLPAGMTWENLAAMSPDEIRDKNVFPGFYPLPHQPSRAACSSAVRDRGDQEAEGLTTLRLDFDLPDHFCPSFRPPSI